MSVEPVGLYSSLNTGTAVLWLNAAFFFGGGGQDIHTPSPLEEGGKNNSFNLRVLKKSHYYLYIPSIMYKLVYA